MSVERESAAVKARRKRYCRALAVGSATVATGTAILVVGWYIEDAFLTYGTIALLGLGLIFGVAFARRYADHGATVRRRDGVRVGVTAGFIGWLLIRVFSEVRNGSLTDPLLVKIGLVMQGIGLALVLVAAVGVIIKPAG